MGDPNQLEIPASFLALFLLPGKVKPTQTRAFITDRYEICEDLSNHLFDYARSQHHDLGIAEDEVLRRCHAGLVQESSGLSETEATWVVRRLAELEGWEWCGPVTPG